MNLIRKSTQLIFFAFALFIVASCGDKDKDEPVIDQSVLTEVNIDGDIYHSVKIGNQVWLVENLRVVKYRNGDSIPNVVGNNDWSNITSGAYCNYDNSNSNTLVYGRLYNWFAVTDARMLAPTGWHIPSDAEWKALVDTLGGSLIAGAKLKELGASHWIGQASNVTNESFFTALPGGYRTSSGIFASKGTYGYWWTSTDYFLTNAWGRYLSSSANNVFQSHVSLTIGYSVRCVKD